MKLKKLGFLVLGLTLVSGLASADSVTGTLGLSGYITVFPLELQFGIDNTLPTSQTSAVSTGTGTFAGLGFPTTATTMDVFQGTGPGQINPGGASTQIPFISVVTSGGPVNVDLASLPLPVDPVCNGVSDTVACRPNAASPIVLTPLANGTFAELSGTGLAYFTATPSMTSNASIVLSADFAGMTIDQILSGFAKTGSVATNYSDNLMVTAAATTVPEPGTLAFIGLGLVSLGAWKKRKAVE